MSDDATDDPSLPKRMNVRPFSMQAIDDLFLTIYKTNERPDAQIWDNTYLACVKTLLDNAPDRIPKIIHHSMRAALEQIRAHNDLQRNAYEFPIDPDREETGEVDIEDFDEKPLPSYEAQFDYERFHQWLADKTPSPTTELLKGLAAMRNALLPFVVKPTNTMQRAGVLAEPAALQIIDQFIRAYGKEGSASDNRLPEDYEQLWFARYEAVYLRNVYNAVAAISQNGNLESLKIDVHKLRTWGYEELSKDIDALSEISRDNRDAIRQSAISTISHFPASADRLFDKIIDAYRADEKQHRINYLDADKYSRDYTKDQHALLREVHAIRWAKIADKLGNTLDKAGYQQACYDEIVRASRGR